MEITIGLIFQCPQCKEICVYHDYQWSDHACPECRAKMEFINEIKKDSQEVI